MTEVTVFTTSWCGPCQRLKAQLTREGIAFVTVDIETDEDAAVFVASANNGSFLVPTVQMASGKVLSNPSVSEIKEHLAATL